MRFGRIAFIATLFAAVALQAQNVPQAVHKYGYADQIIVNARIVSMDDQGYNNNPGHTYEAMAIKGDRIMALGTNQEIKAVADQDTKTIDMGGRLLMPGIIDTHAHTFGNVQIAQNMGIHIPDRGVNVTVQAGKDMEATRLKIENSIKDAVSKLKPGDWVNVGVNPNQKEGVTASRVAAWVSRGEMEPKDRLNNIAPQNPVKVQAGTRATINKAAFDLAEKLMPHFTEYEADEVPDVDDASRLGIVAVGGITAIEWDIWYGAQPVTLLSQMVRKEWEMAAAHGETTFGSRVHNPKIMNSVSMINRQGESPLRFMALPEMHRRPAAPEFIRQLYRMMGNFTGIGDNMMWVGGVASELWDSSFPQVCLGNDLPAPPNIKIREKCPKPGEMYWDTLQGALETGWRLAGIHGVGSDGVRRYTQLIEMAMKNTGMTVEDIRKMRLTTEHAEALGNIPDLMAKIKDLGIIISVNPIRMLKVKDYVRDYGPNAEKFIEPVKSWLDEGVNVVGQFEGYRGMGYNWYLLATRDADGHVVGPDQKLDRVVVLKMWTTWAPRYMFKEKEIGTLEPGKLADYIVLDQDIFTVPLADMQKIKPQMTVLGGRTTYLGPDMAKALGTEPVGYQYPSSYLPWDRSSMGEGAQ